MVVVPTLLTSEASVAALLERRRGARAGQLDRCIHFAILGDFVDADSSEAGWRLPGFSPPRARHRTPQSAIRSGHADRFFCFIANAAGTPGNRSDGMGAEAAEDRGIQQAAQGRIRYELQRPEGDLQILPSVRYCITLDTDTRLPRDAAKELVGMLPIR